MLGGMASSFNAVVAGLVLDAVEGAPTFHDGGDPGPAGRALLPLQDSKAEWVVSQLAELTPEERQRYENGSFFRSLVNLVLDEEWNDPGRAERAREAEASLREVYGGDADRELADLEAGRHPLQQPR